MKFYIAGKFEDKEQVLQAYERVRKAGHEISYDWTTHKSIKPYIENVDQARVYAENELQGILASDVFVYLTHEKGTTLHMEFGAALAKAKSSGDIKIYAVGEHNDRSIWHFNSLIKRVDTIDEAFADLGLE